MTLFKQLFIGVSMLFLILLAGIEAIYLANSRTHLQNQLASNAQDAATTLALRLGTLGDLEDRVLAEMIVSPVFDRGYFQEIRVLSASGETLVRKVLAPSQSDVPVWFTRALPLGVPGAQSLVSSGWRELGRVVVASYPNFAYQQLWQTGLQTIAWLLALYAAAIAAIVLFLTMLLRPLKDVERFAVAIGERDYTTISLVPRARELARVVVALNGMSGKIRQAVMEESARAEALRREAFVDPLTSLYNRRGFALELQSLVHSRKDVFSSALALVEIRQFGDFNKRVGYQRGDEILVLISDALLYACAGHTALCGRVSGAGFIFAAINIEASELQHLVAAVCGWIQFVLAEQGIDSQLPYSCGATRCEGSVPAFSEMLASADTALERARAKGENGYEIEIFDAATSGGSQAWRVRIERALNEGRIALYSQQVFGLPGRTPAHREVLARLASEDGETIPAARFLPMAARHGLIARLDRRILEKLLEHLSAQSAPVPMTALNVSARTIADPEATRHMFELLDASRDLASRLIFEMTEFGALQDVALAQWFGGEVRRRGAQLALDNFGIHKDSLMLVQALKPLYIKLAPGFSAEIADNAASRFLVTSIVRIAQPFEIGIFAQAVENESLLQLLVDLGLSGYQGRIHSQPAPFA